MPAQELHPDLNDEEVRELLREGVEVFNEGRFFDSHEYFEEIWRSTNPEPRDLFQGLVQVAAGLHIWHHRRRADPAARVLGRGVTRLSPFEPRTFGLDLAALLRALEPWQKWLPNPSGPPPPAPTIEWNRGASVERRRQEIDRGNALERHRLELSEATKQLQQWEDEGGSMSEKALGDPAHGQSQTLPSSDPGR